jgi:hypothetical protein
MKPEPLVHVELVFSELASTPLGCAECAPSDVRNLIAKDAAGALQASVAGAARGTQVVFARAPQGQTTVSYDLRASSDLLAPPRAVLVQDDRFRAFGESLLLLPNERSRRSLRVTVDGSLLPASASGSSLGIGVTRSRTARVDALAASVFVAGSLGTSTFDTGIEHDEGAWLGYTAFDPRPVAAEIAGVRSLLRETFQGDADDHVVFFLSQSRAAASVVGRSGSAVAFVTPDEPWSAALRIAMTKHLVGKYIGGEARIVDAKGKPAAWFHGGVALFYAAHALSHAGLLPPEDARQFINGLLSVQATSALHSTEPADVFARQTAAGALYAARLHALFRARGDRVAEKGAAPSSPAEKSAQRLDDVLLSLVDRARLHPVDELTEGAFVDAVAHALGERERGVFASIFEKGELVALPSDTLGPCFAQRPTRHAEVSLGFDLERTLEAADRVLVGLEPHGNAAKAGLVSGDVLVSSNVHSGRADLPVKLTVQRGADKKTVTYVPKGKEHPGYSFARVAGFTDAQCGKPL